jgi:pyruvate formate lyase activating enzyme
MATGRVFNIAHYTVHDGPGIRTTVFLKGCPMRCVWCCSPQSQSFYTESSVKGDKSWGQDFTAKELFKEVRKDAPFWRRSRGGVTLSGGEPLSQADFAAEFFDICRYYNVHTAIESSLAVPEERAALVTDKTDLVMFDIKAVDSSLHREITGIDNEDILKNARSILESGKEVLVRFPLIPTVNDSEDNIRAIGEFVEEAREGTPLEVLRYHKMGVGIYEELGRPYFIPEAEPPTDGEFLRAKEILRNYKIKVIDF